MNKIIAVFIFCSLLFVYAQSQDFIPLWPEGKKPNFNGKIVTDSLFDERIWRVGNPGIYKFLAPVNSNNGTAVLIIPGGGYQRLSHVYSGYQLANWFTAMGMNAFVLIYRLPYQGDLVMGYLAPLQDAQRAMKIIRSNAAKWKLNPGRIGTLGTSAGGHLASTLGTHLKDVSLINDNLDSTKYNADFMILVSPVISMGQYSHGTSKKLLLGKDPTPLLVKEFSSELQVSAGTPPAFIVHALNDSTVSVRNSLLFYNALIDKKVNASLHIFPQGGHGIRLYENPGSLDLFPQLLTAWMKEKQFLVVKK